MKRLEYEEIRKVLKAGAKPFLSCRGKLRPETIQDAQCCNEEWGMGMESVALRMFFSWVGGLLGCSEESPGRARGGPHRGGDPGHVLAAGTLGLSKDAG